MIDQETVTFPNFFRRSMSRLFSLNVMVHLMQCDLIWLENLNLRGGFKKDIMDYICKKYPDLVPLYDAIYNKRDRSYFRGLEDQAERLAKENSCPFVDNELPYGRAEPGHPVIVDYFYHEEVRGSENTGRRNPKK